MDGLFIGFGCKASYAKHPRKNDCLLIFCEIRNNLIAQKGTTLQSILKEFKCYR